MGDLAGICARGRCDPLPRARRSGATKPASLAASSRDPIRLSPRQRSGTAIPSPVASSTGAGARARRGPPGSGARVGATVGLELRCPPTNLGSAGCANRLTRTALGLAAGKTHANCHPDPNKHFPRDRSRRVRGKYRAGTLHSRRGPARVSRSPAGRRSSFTRWMRMRRPRRAGPR